jgi:hypothetical protein
MALVLGNLSHATQLIPVATPNSLSIDTCWLSFISTVRGSAGLVDAPAEPYRLAGRCHLWA